jgi:hypothetical protein
LQCCTTALRLDTHHVHRPPRSERITDRSCLAAMPNAPDWPLRRGGV